ncbi:MAG: DUF58 domain-containing protein [Cyanobium sp.]
MELSRTLEGPQVRLGMRNLYIVPTRFGWLWLGGTVLLQLVGIQLERNGPLLLSFLMLGLFLLTLHLTHFNLQGVELACEEPAPGFAGRSLRYPLAVRSHGRCEGLQLRFAGEAWEPPRNLNPGLHALSVPWTPARRGLHPPGRLRLQTTAPLGLFVCWSHWRPPLPQLVYPARKAGAVQQLSQTGAEPTTAAPARGGRREGGEEWHDLRPHRPQDPPSRLAWKLLAQGRGSFSKRFATPPEATPLLAPDPALPFEQALEHLSERIWRLHGQGRSFGLLVRGQRIATGSGAAHRDRCLAALALCR